jgi:hypothetical protein
MQMDRYRISCPTMALILEGDRHVSVTVPEGATINIEGETFKWGQARRRYLGWQGRHDVHAGSSITRQKDRMTFQQPCSFRSFPARSEEL